MGSELCCFKISQHAQSLLSLSLYTSLSLVVSVTYQNVSLSYLSSPMPVFVSFVRCYDDRDYPSQTVDKSPVPLQNGVLLSSLKQ